jgi:hypothetical protein
MMEGGEDGDGNNEDDNNNAQQLHKYKKTTICLFICNSCCAVKATRQHAHSLNIDMIFMDVLLCGENGLSGQQGMNHHASPGELQ